MTRVAILQSNYIPWKGYFDLIASVDTLVILDSVQYTKQDWRNRNRIKTKNGPHWLTVPVVTHGRLRQPIDAVEIADTRWAAAHRQTLMENYRAASHFKTVFGQLAAIYDAPPTTLSVLNRQLMDAIAKMLGIRTDIRMCRDFVLQPDRSDRLVSLCQQVGASTYVSGAAAKTYLDPRAFALAGIDVEWFDYANYPEYPQLFGSFVHDVTVLDLLFNCGPDARSFMKYVR